LKVTSVEDLMRAFIAAPCDHGNVRKEPAPLSSEQMVAFRQGIALYDEGAWWEAHEAWEAVWIDLKAEGRPMSEVRLLQGLIQCAALLFNHRRGTSRGVLNQWSKLEPKLNGWTCAWGVDVPAQLERLRPYAEDAAACALPYENLSMPMMEDGP
jgi:hypothetical protein